MHRTLLLLAMSGAIAACNETADDRTVATTEGYDTPTATDNVMAPAEPGIVDDNMSRMATGEVAPGTPMNAQQFAQTMAASDAYEIESSRLALERIERGPLRDFAQQMVNDHQRSTTQLRTAADGIAVNPAMQPQQQAMMTELRAAEGDGFAQLYRTQQTRAHEMALANLRSYANTGDNERLKAFAARTAPVVENHLQMLRNM